MVPGNRPPGFDPLSFRMLKLKRHLTLFLAVLVASAALLVGGAAPASAGSGSSGTLLPLCSSWGGLTVDGLGSASYVDPFYGNTWRVDAHVTGYIGVQGAPFCPATQLYGDATHTSFAVRVTMQRYVYPGVWVTCADRSDFTTGQNRPTATVNFGPDSGMPTPCWYYNWPAGWTHISGNVVAQWNPTGHIYDPGTRGGVSTFDFYA